LRKRLGLEDIVEFLAIVKRKDDNKRMKKCMEYKVEVVNTTRTWNEKVEEDIRKLR